MTHLLTSDQPGNSGTIAVVGSYTPATGGRGAGLTLARLSPGAIELGDTVEAPSPSFVAWVADVVVAAHETKDGALGSYRLVDDRLRPVSNIDSEGGRPCHVAVHPSGRFVASSNYASGTFATFPISADGQLGPATGVIEHVGSGPHPTRQNVPHPHSVTFSRDGRWAALLDISLDTVSIHKVELDHSRLGAKPVSVLQLPRGSGPRHAALLPRAVDGTENLAVVGEIDASLHVIAWDGAILNSRPTGHPSLPAGSAAWPSEIASTADGTVVVANRLTSSLTLHAPSATGYRLDLLREVPLPGANPRHFAIVDSVAYVAMQDSDCILAVKLGSDEISATASLRSPSCIAPQRPI